MWDFRHILTPSNVSLSRYILDGRYNIDNNGVENAIRPLAIGRKNYLFCGNHDAAVRAAIVYSLFSSCKAHGVDVRSWLEDTLQRIPTETQVESRNRLGAFFIKLSICASAVGYDAYIRWSLLTTSPVGYDNSTPLPEMADNCYLYTSSDGYLWRSCFELLGVNHTSNLITIIAIRGEILFEARYFIISGKHHKCLQRP